MAEYSYKATEELRRQIMKLDKTNVVDSGTSIAIGGEARITQLKTGICIEIIGKQGEPIVRALIPLEVGDSVQLRGIIVVNKLKIE